MKKLLALLLSISMLFALCAAHAESVDDWSVFYLVAYSQDGENWIKMTEGSIQLCFNNSDGVSVRSYQNDELQMEGTYLITDDDKILITADDETTELTMDENYNLTTFDDVSSIYMLFSMTPEYIELPAIVPAENADALNGTYTITCLVMDGVPFDFEEFAASEGFAMFFGEHKNSDIVVEGNKVSVFGNEPVDFEFEDGMLVKHSELGEEAIQYVALCENGIAVYHFLFDMYTSLGE